MANKGVQPSLSPWKMYISRLEPVLTCVLGKMTVHKLPAFVKGHQGSSFVCPKGTLPMLQHGAFPPQMCFYESLRIFCFLGQSRWSIFRIASAAFSCISANVYKH